MFVRASFSRANSYFSRVSVFSFLAIQANSFRDAKGMHMQLNSPSLLEAFPTISFGSPPKSWSILGVYRYWMMEETGETVPMAAMV